MNEARIQEKNLGLLEFKGQNVLDEVWQELLRCSICNERVAVVSIKSTDTSRTLIDHIVCVRCLPDVCVKLAHKALEELNKFANYSSSEKRSGIPASRVPTI